MFTKHQKESPASFVRIPRAVVQRAVEMANAPTVGATENGKVSFQGLRHAISVAGLVGAKAVQEQADAGRVVVLAGFNYTTPLCESAAPNAEGTRHCRYYSSLKQMGKQMGRFPFYTGACVHATKQSRATFGLTDSARPASSNSCTTKIFWTHAYAGQTESWQAFFASLDNVWFSIQTMGNTKTPSELMR